MDELIEAPRTTSDELIEAHAEAATPETFEQLTARQNRERIALMAHHEREWRATEAATIDALNRDVAASLAAVLDEEQQRLRADRTKNELYAVARYGAPSEAKALERIAAEAAPGERPGLVIVPTPTAHDGPDRRAWMFVDVSDVVWR